MSYYCIKCKTNYEDSVREELEKELRKTDMSATVCFPKKTVREKQKDRTWIPVTRALLPGYLLVSSYVTIENLRDAVREIKHANYVLRYDNTMYELQAGDKKYAEWIFNNEGILKPSKVYLEPGERIQIISGPLFGMEGKIVSVKRRERRATISLPFGETNNTISLSIDIIDKM